MTKHYYAELFRRPEVFEWFCMTDPGSTTSAFAVLFGAFYRPDPFLFLFDEIYETNPQKTTVGHICPRIVEIYKRYNPNHLQWRFCYDPAAAWFALDANARYASEGLIFAPSPKRQGDKEEGINLIDEMMVQNRILFSTNCTNAIWEIDNYFKDKNGNYIKANDHQIDNLRYLTKVGVIILQSDDNALNRLRFQRKKREKRYFSIADDEKRGYGQNWRQMILSKYGLNE